MVEDLVAQCFLMIFGLLCDEVVLCGLNRFSMKGTTLYILLSTPMRLLT